MIKLNDVNKILNKLNLNISKYNNSDNYKLAKIFSTQSIDLVIDVGANIGQYGKKLREIGFKNKIYSIEPNKDVFNILKSNIINDNNWVASNFALGEVTKKDKINISKNTLSSSISRILKSHLKVTPEAKVIETQDIKVYKLDDIFKDLGEEHKSIYLKLDTQGYESYVIKGAKESLKNITGIELELSLVQLYDGEKLFFEMCDMLVQYNFQLVLIVPEFFNKITGRQLQVNCIFFKEGSKILN